MSLCNVQALAGLEVRRIRRSLMASAMKDEAARSLDAHARSIDALHQKLAAVPGVDKDRLQKAVDKYKAAHQTFHDDALGSMN